MGAFISLVGQRFGRLVVSRRVSTVGESGDLQWRCRCDCGRTTRVLGWSLRSGRTKSCGCLRREVTVERLTHRNDPVEFWALVSKTDGCWIWNGPVSREGYGVTTWSGTRIVAHRHAYALTKGHCPDTLMRTCANRNCVNPDHMAAMSASEFYERRQRDLFAAKVRPSDNGCLEWTGAISSRGYGRVTIGKKTRQPHRVSYEWTVGKIKDGMILDHLCRNPRCVNPDHLEEVTNAENVRRGNAGMNMSAKTHCPHGHPYDDANTKWYDGRRYCRACHKKRTQSRKRHSERTETTPVR